MKSHQPAKSRISHVSPADKGTREQLLDAAAILFAEQGIADTTVANIAAYIGVTSAMVHYYFKTRNQLLDAFVTERISPLIFQVWEPVTGKEENPLEVIQGLIRRILIIGRIPWFPRIWIREIANEGGLLSKKVMKCIPHKKIEHFKKCIESAQKQGILNQHIEPGLLVMSMISMTMLPLATANIWTKMPEFKHVGIDGLNRHIKALLMHGMVNASCSSIPKKER